MKSLLNLFLITTAAGSLSAAVIQSEGIIGNSGTEKNPVILGQKQFPDHRNCTSRCQSNPVYDPERGLLYMIVNGDRMNAYTLDGYMEASWPLKKCSFGPPHASRVLTRCGNKLYFLRQDELWSLPLNAQSGTPAEKTPFQLLNPLKNWRSKSNVCLSRNAKDGKLALFAENHLYLYDTVSGKTEEVCSEKFDQRFNSLCWRDDGTFFAFTGNSAIPLKNWKKGSAVKFIGRAGGTIGAVFCQNYLFTAAGHGTVCRYTADKFQPEPGVVYGGASGAFIGTVFVDPDVIDTAGIEPLGNDLFAVSGGTTGTVIILHWNEASKKMERMRRIGSLPEVKTLVLDSKGNIGAGSFITGWDADTDTPMAGSCGNSCLPAAAAETAPDQFLSFGEGNGPHFVITTGPLTDQRGFWRRKGRIPFKDAAGAACIKLQNKKTRAFMLSEKGRVCCVDVQAFGPRKTVIQEQTDVKFIFSEPVQRFTGLASVDDSTLLAAGDGKLIVLHPDGDSWKEVSRWKQTFNPVCRIAARDGKIVITEESKNRLSVFRYDGSLIAETEISSPGAAAVNGNRILVHETQKERIRKLVLKED